MENATNALIMAATVLIGVIILSLGVYLFTYMGGYAKDVNNEVRNNQIAQFNSQFLSYKEKEKITIYDVISLANLAKDNNSTYGFSISDTNKTGYIQVNIVGALTISNFENSVSSFDLKSNANFVYKDLSSYELRTYKCENISISDVTQLVDKITIKAE